MQIGKQEYPFSSSKLEGGGKNIVGVTPVAVNFTIVPTQIIITADKDNTGILYIGNSNITSSGDNSLTYLMAGDIITLDYNNQSPIYVVSSISTQYYWKGALQ